MTIESEFLPDDPLRAECVKVKKGRFGFFGNHPSVIFDDAILPLDVTFTDPRLLKVRTVDGHSSLPLSKRGVDEMSLAERRRETGCHFIENCGVHFELIFRYSLLKFDCAVILKRLNIVANVVPAPFDYVGDQKRMVLLPEEVGEKGFLESHSPTFQIDSSRRKACGRTVVRVPSGSRRQKRALDVKWRFRCSC
ncbi:hypothetical protein TNCV_3458361 [Trichonephila clavipes]|nr:hypothetical protein TNCV_3458361 [Trichonephila clavipes]